MPTQLFNEVSKEKQDLIKRSFLKLLQNKPLDKITFNCLAKEAGIARTSLYVYFKDKKDLCDFVFYDLTQIIENTLNKSEQETTNLFLYAKDIFNVFQETIIQLKYEQIIKNIAIGIKTALVHEYEFFDVTINYIKNRFLKSNNSDIIEMILILLQHNILLLFFNFESNNLIKDKFYNQINILEKYYDAFN